MMPIAMIVAPPPGRSTSSVAVATRSAGACWICVEAAASPDTRRWRAGRGRSRSKVPSASDSGMLRRGSFTSPAVNVMLFQASAEKSDPVCETQMRDEQAERASAADRPGTMSTCAARRPEVAEVVGDRGVVPAEQQADAGSAPTSAPVFAVVKTFWMIWPYSRPRVLVQVSSAISSDADQLRRRQRQRVAGRQVDRRDQVVVVGNPRHEHAENSARSRPPPRRSCRSG